MRWAKGMGAVAALGLLAGWLTTGVAAPGAAGPELSHCVFFTLKDRSPESARALVAGCEAYLKGHEGATGFAVGTRAEEFERDVNDREYDVFLEITFADRAAHDRYQSHPRHQKFIDECASRWSRVRVFDSYVTH